MECAAIREALSAALDGEASALERQAVESHLASCAACRAHRDDILRLTGAARRLPAGRAPDLVEPVMATVHLPARRAARGWPSYVLCAVALVQFLLAVPAFLLGHAPGAGEHAARELGACDVALAGCLLVAAWQPRRAAGLLPAALAVAAAMAVASITDVAIGHTGAMAEARHVLDVLGLAALWLVARSGAVPAAPRHGRPPVVAA